MVALMFLPLPTEVIVLTGELEPLVEGYASPNDATDYDSTGSWSMWADDSDPHLMEAKLTLGTDLISNEQYKSGQSFWFLCESDAANAADSFSWLVTLPYGPDAKVSTDTMTISYDEANTRWDLTFTLGIEDTHTLKAYTKAGVEVGTTHFDLSNHDYTMSFDIRLAITTNYAGMYRYFDPQEDENGAWDNLYLVAVGNMSAGNANYAIAAPWQICQNGRDYFLDLSPYLTRGMLIRWDENEMDGVVTVELRITSTDVDLSGAGHLLLTIDAKECQGEQQMYYGTYETDARTNWVGAPTSETLQIQD